MEEALKVVSFNVKRDSIFHGSHPWTNRRELVTRLIEESGAAIVGVQELMPAMKEDIRRLLTDYSIFGWGRTRKRTNEHSAILVHEPDWAAVYDQTFWLSKHPEKFGTGIIDGIAASEASNNAATGGAMVPLLSLGIPGGNAAAVMMSALTLKGVQLGPLLLTNQPTYLSATFMSMIVTNILMVIVAMAIAKVFAQILAIPYSYLGPIILMLALIGTYGDQMSATSVQIMVLSGILGLIVRACHLNSAAIVLGLVLGSMCEQNFSRGYLMARANVLQMFNPALHPIAFVLIIVCIVMLISPMVMSMRKKKAAK